MTIRILLVDDEHNVCNAITRLLRQDWRDNALIEAHHRGASALQRAAQEQFDAVVSDYRMPEMDGIEFLTKFRTIQPHTARIILSGTTDFDMLMTAINETEILRFIIKPWDDQELQKAVRLAVETTAQSRNNAGIVSSASGSEPDNPQNAELKRMESLEPGITKVHWGPNGEVLMDEE